MKKLSFLLFVLILANNQVEAQEQNENQVVDFKRNTVHFVMSDIVFKRVSFEFEHIIGDEGKIAIKIPVSYSFGDPNTIYKSLQNTEFQQIQFKHMVDFSDWYVGLGANLYPKGQGAFRFYVGTEIRLGPASRYPEEYYYGYEEYYYDVVEDILPAYEEESYLQTSFILNAGVGFQPVDELVFSLNLSLGLKTSLENDVTPIFLPVFRMGYMF